VTFPKDTERAREEFLAEAQELLETLSRNLLSLDSSLRGGSRSPETVNDLFRGVHTLKGLAGMFGFERLGRMSHVLEDLLEDLRLGRIDLTQQVLDVLFEGVDAFQRLLADRAEQDSVDVEAFGVRVHALARSKQDQRSIVHDYEFDSSMLSVLTEYEEHRLRSNLEQGATVYRLRVRLGLDVIDTALDQFKERTKNIAEIITYLPSMDGGADDSIEIEMLLASKRAEDELRTVLGRPDATLSAVPKRAGAVRVAPTGTAGVAAVASPPPTASAASSATPARAASSAALAPLVAQPQAQMPAQPRAAVEEAPPGSAAPASAPENENGGGKRRDAEVSMRSISSVVRVDIRKLDYLMNVVGELGTVRASLSRLVERLRTSGAPLLSTEAHRIHRAFQRHLAEVQDGVLDIRMVPLSQLFDKMAVIVRQVAREQQKDVRLVINGAETEVDKLIAEELVDPMMHIVRNAIDHGVESLEQRQQRGKPATATLTLTAHQKGNHVVIEHADDGSGIDSNVIREAAVRKGLLTEQSAGDLTRDELLNLIFMPGFSTARKITDISGRGVGMDVVKTNITRLGGAVDIESEVGLGTKVTITLPITLAIISALLFEVRGRLFAIPLAVVQEALRLPASAVRWVDGREVITLRGTTLPLCRLATLFGLGELSAAAGENFVIVVSVGNRRLGLCVERLSGQQDVVIKGLGRSLTGIQGIAGATDLGDQDLVLVLDAASIIEEVLLSRAGGLTAGVSL
jgi:two-component system chemotaxis sensor kinase CheA